MPGEEYEGDEEGNALALREESVEKVDSDSDSSDEEDKHKDKDHKGRFEKLYKGILVVKSSYEEVKIEASKDDKPQEEEKDGLAKIEESKDVPGAEGEEDEQ